MATYILKKDLPDLKAGAEFSLCDGIEKKYFHTTDTIIDLGFKTFRVFNYTSDVVENNPTWFEIKEDKPFDFINKYTKEDMRKCFNEGFELSKKYPKSCTPFEDFIDSLNK